MFLYKVKALILVATDFLALVVKNTITITPFKILAFYYIKEVKLRIKSKI